MSTLYDEMLITDQEAPLTKTLFLFPSLLVIVFSEDKLALRWKDRLKIIVYNRCMMEGFNKAEESKQSSL